MQPSKILGLDEETRQELDKKLLQGGFQDYRGLATWLEEKGFFLSKSTVARYGQKLQQKIEKIKIAVEQSKALCENVPNDEGNLNKALLYLIQQKTFDFLIELENLPLDPKKVDISQLGRMIADLSRASVSAEKYSKEVRKRTEEAIKEVEKTQGLSVDAANQIKRKIMGIP